MFSEEEKKFIRSNKKMVSGIIGKLRDELREVGLTYPRGEERDNLLDTANYIDNKLISLIQNIDKKSSDEKDGLNKYI